MTVIVAEPTERGCRVTLLPAVAVISTTLELLEVNEIAPVESLVAVTTNEGSLYTFATSSMPVMVGVACPTVILNVLVVVRYTPRAACVTVMVLLPTERGIRVTAFRVWDNTSTTAGELEVNAIRPVLSLFGRTMKDGSL